MADRYESRARKARLKLAGVGVGVGVVLAVGGALVVTLWGDDDGVHGSPDLKPSPSASSTASPGFSAVREFTPATAPPIPLLKPATNSGGSIGTGFEHSNLGAVSAGVSYWEDLDLLDDVLARKQWKAIAAADSPETVDQGVSEVRKVREGVGLPPSGGTPDGITFSTSVKAALGRSLDKTGNVVVVWLSYDRFATIRDKGADDNPLRDETTSLVLKWESGDWKVTTDPQWTAKVKGPHAYAPDSKYAWLDGWRQVSDD
ncbi:hypothetical protein [Streptomyces olivaceus]